jgi:hypothetical protein
VCCSCWKKGQLLLMIFTKSWKILEIHWKKIDKFFGMKNYLHRNLTAIFESEALKVYIRALNYLEKWFPFESLQYRTFQVLSLEKGWEISIFIWHHWHLVVIPLEEWVSIRRSSRRACCLRICFLSLSGNSIEKWCSFFSKESAPNLLKIVQYVM